jgi:uncharacterized lipoprotein YajG
MMTVPFRRVLEVVLLCSLMVAGCGVHHGNTVLIPDRTPLANEAVAIRVLSDAWSALGIPSAKDTGVSVGVAGDSASAELAGQVAREKLTALGYRIAPDKAETPRATVIVDTLRVVVAVRSGLLCTQSVERSARTVLIVTFDYGDSPAKVFRASGEYRDVIPYANIGMISDKHTYVLEQNTGHWFTRYAKAFGLTVFMTVFAWSLYSYHG